MFLPLIDLASNAVFIIGLMCVGAWLERINGKHGLWDELLTPLPMGLGGMLVIIERAWA
jgi:hypothetical protein